MIVKNHSVCLLLITVLFFPLTTFAKDKQKVLSQERKDLSLKMELEHAIFKGLKWLEKAQQEPGSWSQVEYPALTGLVLTAFLKAPGAPYRVEKPEFIKKGYGYLLKNVHPNGGIYGQDLANHNTAISIMALKVSGDVAYEETIKKARNFLVGLQAEASAGKKGDPLNGGIGYGNRYKHSDMSNTLYALEALYYTRDQFRDKEKLGEQAYKELDWQAVIGFVERCQNLPGFNDQAWASDDPQNKGGFVYFPGNSKAGEVKLPSGKTALRSYGSISYAGLLSYIYADLKRNDPRVQAVFDWLQKNYTLEENPGMGAQGLFYYYHTMAKALSIYGANELVLEDGRKVDWRKDLALKLLNLQKGDGFWVNENGRWWEKDPVLVTAYAVIALEILHKGM